MSFGKAQSAFLVPMTGLEPARLSTSAPKADVSTVPPHRHMYCGLGFQPLGSCHPKLSSTSRIRSRLSSVFFVQFLFFIFDKKYPGIFQERHLSVCQRRLLRGLILVGACTHLLTTPIRRTDSKHTVITPALADDAGLSSPRLLGGGNLWRLRRGSNPLSRP